MLKQKVCKKMVMLLSSSFMVKEQPVVVALPQEKYCTGYVKGFVPLFQPLEIIMRKKNQLPQRELLMS